MRPPSLELVRKSGILEISTADPGSEWAQLSDKTCNQVVIYNDTGVTLQVRKCNLDGEPIDGESYLTLKDGNALPMRGLSNACEVQVKREDDDNTQLVVVFYYEKGDE